MKFSIGDKVLLKRTGEEAHVTSHINEHMLEVEIHGTTFPVHTDDIEHPYLKWFTEKKQKRQKGARPEQLPVEKITERVSRLAQGVYLSFLPVYKIQDMEEVVDVLKVYLLNEMPLAIKYSYDVRFANKSEFSHEGSLHSFGNVYLHSINYAEMNEQPRFHWRVTESISTGMAAAEGILRIRPAKLFEQVTQLMSNNEATFSYLLMNEFKPPAKPEPIEKFVPAHAKKLQTVTARNIEQPKSEIDLHIEALVSNHKGLSNAEIIKIQLDALQHHIHLAIVHRQERIIIIHGLGKGKLREEVHAILKQMPEVSRFKNEWSGRYGFGATEVWLRYD